MKLNKAIKAVFFTLGMLGAFPANASITYTYTDSNEPRFTGNVAYSGSFSVTSTLADGSYHFASAAVQPAGFTENFFIASFVDHYGVTRTPSISVFDITISNGQVSTWDIEAKTPYTRAQKVNNTSYVTHAAVLTYHDSTTGDFQTSYDVGFAYQESLSGLLLAPGVWSITTTPAVSAVPLPPPIGIFAAGLLGFGALSRKNPTKQNFDYAPKMYLATVRY